MVKLGNFFFHYRNMLFPVFYAAMFIPSPQLTVDFYTAAVIGGLIALSGEAVRMMTIGLAYIVRGGKNRRVYAEDLVTDGLYAHCRNPMYVGNVLMIAGTGILSNNLYFVCIGVPFFIFIWQAIIMAEENYLSNKFGEGFDRYVQDTNRWIPRLKGLGQTLSAMEFKWRRVILKEYNTTWYWVLGCIFLLMIQELRYAPANYEKNKVVWFVLLGFFTVAWALIKYMKKRKLLTAK